MKKKIMIYKKDSTLAIATMSELYSGAWAFDKEVFSIDIDKSSEIVGVCKKALSYSRSGLHEDDFDWKNLNAPLLKALKVRSMKLLYLSCVCVSVEEELNFYKFTPSINLKDGGFQHLVDQSIVIPVQENNDGDFISSLMKALSACVKE